MSLVCPMCSEALEEEGSHFYKHFKYKRYACGEQSCDQEFYTEADRNAHCSRHAHKRSFQKTVNPYIDKMIADLVFDARELCSKDMETVIENRWKNREVQIVQSPQTLKSSSSTPSLSKSSEMSQPRNKRSLIGSSGTARGAKKTRKSNAEETPRRPTTQPIVDSTTSEIQMTLEKEKEKEKEKPKQTRKRRTDSELNQSTSSAPDTIEKMSALDKLVGWFDQKAPEHQDEAKIQCSECGHMIIYDFILRKGHVTKEHMAADVDPTDYNELLHSMMNKCFPEMPNSDLACQLCMTGADVRKNARREHIEKVHVNNVIPLKCPVESCLRGYKRQCDLSTHMREAHKLCMPRCKNAEFQYIRRRRNFQISELIKKCFPWSEVEKLEHPVAPPEVATSSDPLEAENVVRDVRLADAHKTRRAPLYNQDDSSSESELDEGNASETAPTEDFSDDVIFIGNHFNSQIAEMLSHRNACIPVKTEPRVSDDVEVVRQELHVNLEEEEMKQEEEEKETNGLPQPAIVEPPPSLMSIITATPPPRAPYSGDYSERRFDNRRDRYEPTNRYDRSRRDDYRSHRNSRSYRGNSYNSSRRNYNDRY